MGGQLGFRAALALSGKIMKFVDKWIQAQQKNKSRLAIGLAPRLVEMPAPIMRYDDPFLPFGRAIIENTQDLVCAYVFDLASYLTLGAAGARALERTIPIVPDNLPRILHGPFVTAAYVKTAEAFAVDAVTLTAENPEVILPYIEDERRAVFLQKTVLHRPNIGTYTENHVELGGSRVLWITDPIIYASGKMDFEEQVRAAAEKYRNKSHE